MISDKQPSAGTVIGTQGLSDVCIQVESEGRVFQRYLDA